jgi:hypothetical protein
MTIGTETGNVLWMTKRLIPREGTTPTEYKLALAARIKMQREKLDMSHAEVARLLSQAVGREIRADSYRQWETEKSIVQVDAILPLCDILRIHVYDLLGKPIVKDAVRPVTRGKAVA